MRKPMISLTESYLFFFKEENQRRNNDFMRKR